MTRLTELQLALRDFVLARSERATSEIVGDDISAIERLRVYRHGYVDQHHYWLSACYPIARSILGSRCFAALSRAYLESRPPKSFSPHEFCAAFPNFLNKNWRSRNARLASEMASWEKSVDLLSLVSERQSKALADAHEEPLVFRCRSAEIRLRCIVRVEACLWNTPELWLARTSGARRQKPEKSLTVRHFALWRADGAVRFVEIRPCEALALEAARRAASLRKQSNGENEAGVAHVLVRRIDELVRTWLVRGWI